MAPHQHHVKYIFTFSFLVVSKRDHRANSFNDRQSNLASLSPVQVALQANGDCANDEMHWMKIRWISCPLTSDTSGELVGSSFETTAPSES